MILPILFNSININIIIVVVIVIIIINIVINVIIIIYDKNNNNGTQIIIMEHTYLRSLLKCLLMVYPIYIHI